MPPTTSRARLRQKTADVEIKQKVAEMLELEIAKGKAFSEVRINERKEVLAGLRQLFETMRSMPGPNYSGVHTLVASGGGSDATSEILPWGC